MQDKEKILIFNIQKYSLHDGSGIRTVVFMKGCPLRCRWCCNPESQLCRREVMYRKSKCIGKDKCGLCEKAAPAGCISFDENGIANLDFKKAEGNPDWTEICPTKALIAEGREISIREVLDIVEKDSAFYKSGNGGLTVSGGEPLMQENTLLLLKCAKERYLSTAIETCGCVPTDRLLEAANYLDEIFFDIKSVNDTKHKEYTGSENLLIRENLKTLRMNFPDKKITVRTPVIPGFNDSEDELSVIETFLSNLPGITWEKLPYHTYGVSKYAMLGREYGLN